jgi:hypothetical protein
MAAEALLIWMLALATGGPGILMGIGLMAIGWRMMRQGNAMKRERLAREAQAGQRSKITK